MCRTCKYVAVAAAHDRPRAVVSALRLELFERPQDAAAPALAFGHRAARAFHSDQNCHLAVRELNPRDFSTHSRKKGENDQTRAGNGRAGALYLIMLQQYLVSQTARAPPRPPRHHTSKPSQTNPHATKRWGEAAIAQLDHQLKLGLIRLWTGGNSIVLHRLAPCGQPRTRASLTSGTSGRREAVARLRTMSSCYGSVTK